MGVVPSKKKFKVKIRLIADYYDEEGTGGATKSVSQAVEEWYDTVGMASLLGYLNQENLLYKSYLNNFQSTPDSVDKEAFD